MTVTQLNLQEILFYAGVVSVVTFLLLRLWKYEKNLQKEAGEFKNKVPPKRVHSLKTGWIDSPTMGVSKQQAVRSFDLKDISYIVATEQIDNEGGLCSIVPVRIKMTYDTSIDIDVPKSEYEALLKAFQEYKEWSK